MYLRKFIYMLLKEKSSGLYPKYVKLQGGMKSMYSSTKAWES